MVAFFLGQFAYFDAANRLVVGIDESKLLRWLIRNRQRAGIKKQYDEEHAKPGVPAEDAEEELPSVTPTPTSRPHR